MNTTLRRISTVVMAMFLTLMVFTTWIQFVQADSLNNHARNTRTIYDQYCNFRGPIVVGGESVVASSPVDAECGYQRVYGGGDPAVAQLYAPVTGFYSIVNGATAIERTEDGFLSGEADSLWLDRLQNLITGEEVQGSSVELTIDPAVQQAAWDALGDRRGAVVALEPSTGKILAMVSKPTYDPNPLAVFSSEQAGSAYKELLNTKVDGSPYGILINRATSAVYPPGSTFKLVTAAAALESGQYTASTEVAAPATYQPMPSVDYHMRNFGNIACSPTDKMSLLDALRISCNTAFGMLGVELGEEALQDQAEQFGFGQDDLEVPLAVEQSYVFDEDSDPAILAQSAIGQRNVRATPLQVAMLSAAIANDGELMEPYLVQAVRDSDTAVIEEATPRRLRTAVQSSTAEALTQMMLAVVNDGSGTAAQIPGVQVAGKTGTAQNGADQPTTLWFTAFAPADDPQVAVAVVLEKEGQNTDETTGGRLASPVARQVIEAVLAQ